MKKIGLIGAGVMGYNHARVLSDINEIILVGVSDIDQNNLDKVTKFCKNKYLDYNDLLMEELDAVVICTPTKLHKEIAIKAMNKGIHVFVEKPIAINELEAKAMIDCAKNNSVHFTVGHIERFNPAIQFLKKELDEGNLGKAYKINIHRAGPFAKRIRDTGVIIDLAIHDIDIARYLIGSEYKRLYAETQRKIHTAHEDLFYGLLTFQNEAVLNLNVNWLTPTKIRKLMVNGEKGMYELDYISQELYFYENPEYDQEVLDAQKGISEGKQIKFMIRNQEPLRLEMEHFLDILNGKKPCVSAEDATEALRICSLLLKSAELHEVVKCELE